MSFTLSLDSCSAYCGPVVYIQKKHALNKLFLSFSDSIQFNVTRLGFVPIRGRTGYDSNGVYDTLVTSEKINEDADG